MPHVSVIIDEKTYRMACDDGQEEHLKSLGDEVDQAIQTLKEGFGDIGDQRLAIMAGILMADKHSESQRKIRALEAEIAALKDNRSSLVDRNQTLEESVARALNDVANRVQKMANKLNARSDASNKQQTAAE